MAVAPRVFSTSFMHANRSVSVGSSISKCDVRQCLHTGFILRMMPGNTSNLQDVRDRRKDRPVTFAWSRGAGIDEECGGSEEEERSFPRAAVAAILAAFFTVGDPFSVVLPRHEVVASFGTIDSRIVQQLTRVLQTPSASASGLLQMPPTSLNNRYDIPSHHESKILMCGYLIFPVIFGV